jgi:hypothetical protein
MYVEIHSRSETDEESSGKTMWVNASTQKVAIETSAPEHLGAPPWHIEVVGKTYVEYSNGHYGGNYKGVIRRLLLQLTPEDVAELVNVAFANGLLDISTKIRKASRAKGKVGAAS